MTYARPLPQATERRLEDEAAVLAALRAAEAVPYAMPEQGLNRVQLFGWCPLLARPDGWSVHRAELAAVRLANRGAIAAVPGGWNRPRRWRLG